MPWLGTTIEGSENEVEDMMRMEQIELYGHHGVFTEENKLGQKFIIDLTMFLDLKPAGISDSLEDTIDYAQVYEQVKHIVTGPAFQLIEALAERIADEILKQFEKVQRIIVKVTKPNPPFQIHFQGVSVQIERKRDEQ